MLMEAIARGRKRMPHPVVGTAGLHAPAHLGPDSLPYRLQVVPVVDRRRSPVSEGKPLNG